MAEDNKNITIPSIKQIIVRLGTPTVQYFGDIVKKKENKKNKDYG